MKTVYDVKTEKFTLFEYCHFLVLLITTVCSQNINNQIVNIADKKLTNYSFHSRYPYTKSKNYLKRQYRICHWIPMFTGTLCISIVFVNKGNLLLKMASFIKISKELDRYQRKKNDRFVTRANKNNAVSRWHFMDKIRSSER